MPKAGLLGMVAAAVCRVPVRLHTFTGQTWSNSRGFKRWFLVFIDKIIIKSATNVFCDGFGQRRFLVQNNVVKSIDDIIVLGNGSHVHPHEITTLRERELLVHLVDLGLGYKANDWTLTWSIKTLKSVSAGKRKEPVKFRLLIAGDHTWTMDQNGMTDIFGTPQSLAAWLMGREPDDKLVTSDGSPLGNPPLWL